jgi:hypothetical protein
VVVGQEELRKERPELRLVRILLLLVQVEMS